jgi:hypothetical protein
MAQRITDEVVRRAFSRVRRVERGGLNRLLVRVHSLLSWGTFLYDTSSLCL